jgi:tetratricopeptide (TPR) repeat protein/4-amino-4-deoxy-L-arabinose transferase-like glycosyltransferase
VGQALLWHRFIDADLPLQPDSPEFVIGARSLATGHGYRDLSQPGLPAIPRPIGMSLLLAPVVGWRGYDIWACKCVSLILATGSAGLSYLVLRKVASPNVALAVLAMISLSPIHGLYAGQVFSEVPYIFYTLALLALVVTSGDRSALGPFRAAGICLLALLAEKTRAQGVALWPALVIWSVLRPDRRRIAPLLAGVGCASVVLNWLGVFGASPTGWYTSYLRNAYADQGSYAVFANGVAAIRFYLGALIGVLAPTQWPDRFFFGLSAPVELPEFAAALVGGAVAVAVVIGVKRRVRETGTWAESTFVMVYLALSFGLLMVWPHRLGRLFFPLLPIAAVYFWGAIARLRRPWIESLLLGAALVGHVAGSTITIAHLSTTKSSISSIGDCESVGKWLRHNTPEHVRVFTTNKALFIHSHRYQRFLFAKSLTLGELNELVLTNGIGYAWFTEWQTDPVLVANPALRFTPVAFEDALHPLLGIEPNTEGTVPRSTPDVDRQLERLEHVTNWPKLRADDPLLRRTQLLLMSDRLREAETLLSDFLEEHGHPDNFNTSVAQMQLGDVLLRSGRPSEAIELYEQARRGVNADFLETVIRESIAVARVVARSLDESAPAVERAEILERLALAHAGLGRWSAALESLERAIQLQPGRIRAQLLRAWVLRRFGDWDAATAQIHTVFAQLRGLQPVDELRWQMPAHLDGFSQLLLIRLPRILQSGTAAEIEGDGRRLQVDPSRPQTYLEAAQLFDGDELPGVALAMLRLGVERHPKEAGLWAALGSRLVAFGRFDEARDALRRAHELDADSTVGALLESVVQWMASPPVR